MSSTTTARTRPPHAAPHGERPFLRVSPVSAVALASRCSFLQHFTGTLDNWIRRSPVRSRLGERFILMRQRRPWPLKRGGASDGCGNGPAPMASRGARIERCDVLGYSLGGMIALQMVRTDRRSFGG